MSENPSLSGITPQLVCDAAELIVATQFGSASMLMRKLQVSMDEAVAALDVLEVAGIVGPYNDGKARKVLTQNTDDLNHLFQVLRPYTLVDADVVASHGRGGVVLELVTEESPGEPEAPAVDFTKPDAAPDPQDGPEDGQDQALEGLVIPAREWEHREDPEGDRPWINPLLKTREGRRARVRYARKQARRRVRKWVARQSSVHGMVPRALRAERRARMWIRGVEGMKARSDKALALTQVAEANRAARRAGIAILDRKTKADAARLAQQQANAAVAIAGAAVGRARTVVATRAALVYGPLAAADLTAWGFGDLWGLAGALVLNLVGASWFGRDVELTEEQLERLERIEAGIPQKFELGMTPRMFEQMMRQALTEDLKVNISALRVDPHPWGFEVQVWLDRMTPERVSAGLNLLEACLPGVRTGSILLQQSAQSRNQCVVRVPGPNPWQAVPELPYRAPQSLSTNEIHTAQIGADMSGRPLALPMCRTNAHIVGKSRSGKSTILRAILDALTATDDQIVIGIDLGSAGSGFGGLRRAMHVVATNPRDAQRALWWALDVGKGRPALFDKLGMGLNWETSRKRPGIKIVVDEFPALVRESRKGYFDEDGKKISWDLDGLLQEFAMTSAKSDGTVIIAGQGVTKEKIGANTWVVELGVQVLAACDNDDVQQILGGGAMGEGWRPDRLVPAMGAAVNDASVAYVLAGTQYCEPIPYRACITSEDELLRRGTERRKASLVEIDAESAAFSSIRLEDLMATSDEETFPTAETEGMPQLIATIREIFTDAKDPAGLSQAELADALGQVDPERWGLEHFDGDDGDKQVTARIDALRKTITAVLVPSGQSWVLEKYSSKLPRGYRLRDLKVITGETSADS